MASRFEWNKDGDKRDAIHMIVQALAEGKVVGLPTETSYVLAASCLQTEAAGQIAGYAANTPGTSLSLVVRSGEEIQDYCPSLSPVGHRLVSRGLPGPLVVELACDDSSSLVHQLDQGLVRELMADNKYVGLRLPSHEAIQQAMRLLRGPVIACELVQGGAVATNMSAADQACPEFCGFLVDDGDCHFAAPPSRVRVDENRCTLLAQGAAEADKLQQLTQLAILVVCTGNTCRSPMAGALLTKLLSDKFPSTTGDGLLPFYVGTAGISAFPGSLASQQAKVAMKQRGLSLSDHSSTPVTQHSIERADFVLAMTQSHRAAILDAIPEAAPKVQLLSGGKGDVSDPFGGSQAVYDACADQIEGFLTDWCEQVDRSWIPEWKFD